MQRMYLVGALALVGCGIGADGFTEDDEGLGTEQSIRYDQELADWLPPVLGNRWELAPPGHAGHSAANWVIRVQEQSEKGARVSGLLRTKDLWLKTDERVPNVILAFNEDTEAWGPFLRFDRRSWRFEGSADPCDAYKVTRVGDEQVTTGVGDFTGKAFRFQLAAPDNVRCAAPPFDRLVLVNGTGPVAMRSASNEEVSSLQHAMIGDTVLHHARMPTALVLEQNQYVSHANTIRCITQPCPSNAVNAVATFALSVQNAEGEMHDCEFRTEKRYDFELVDASGQVVRAWSDGRSFDRNPTVISFEPAETKQLEGSVELVDRNGAQLDGVYTVRASMFGHDQHALPVKGSIVVSVVR